MRLEDRVHVESGLYGATAEQILARVRTVDQHVTSVLVVGHNPGLQDLALELAGDDPDAVTRLSEKFPTGALALVVLAGDLWSRLSPGTVHLASMTVPRDLPP
jgi:phosphohistidine phosphatase